MVYYIYEVPVQNEPRSVTLKKSTPLREVGENLLKCTNNLLMGPTDEITVGKNKPHRLV